METSLLSNIIKSEQSLVVCEPVPMHRPTSAFFIAIASDDPSPDIAHKPPFYFKASTKISLSSPVERANTLIPSTTFLTSLGSANVTSYFFSSGNQIFVYNPIFCLNWFPVNIKPSFLSPFSVERSFGLMIPVS